MATFVRRIRQEAGWPPRLRRAPQCRRIRDLCPLAGRLLSRIGLREPAKLAPHDCAKARAGNRWRIALGSARCSGIPLKSALSGRAGPGRDPQRYLQGLHQLFRLDYDWRVDLGLNIIATPRAHFWRRSGLVDRRRGAVHRTSRPLVIIARDPYRCDRIWRVRLRDRAGGPPRSAISCARGIVAFLLGNATFLIVPAVVFTSTGMDNRVQVAGALGVAMIFVRAFPLRSEPSPASAGDVFSITHCHHERCGLRDCRRSNDYWGEAPALQEAYLAAARADLARCRPIRP